ncbi:PqqD family peptide modification chaperone [Sediminibacterium sp.]|uniref:PqqD family peptide modification chaperone n=1 Tax=Sediminibacterium sp. TaxID=1917865 RepID=UPI003F70D0AC
MTQIIFQENTTLKRKDEHLLISNLGDDMVMMDIEDGTYFSLNKIGMVIWDKLEKNISFSELIQHLIDTYEVERAVCEVETKKLLDSLYEKKMLEIVTI